MTPPPGRFAIKPFRVRFHVMVIPISTSEPTVIVKSRKVICHENKLYIIDNIHIIKADCCFFIEDENLIDLTHPQIAYT